MKYIKEYLNKYGNSYFIEKPVNEVDYLIFSQLIYNDFTGIADKGEITLKEAAVEFFSSHSDEYIGSLIDVANRAATLLTLCSNTKRYGTVIMKNYIDNLDGQLDKQISGVNFVLPDGKLIVAFRGTDASIAGFKESAKLSYMFPVPAQIEALHYFQETAMLHKGDVGMCGHSKGGNLAVFAGVNCSNSVKKQLKNIYAFDAPGFPEWFFDRYDYKQIRDTIHNMNPQSSLVGRALTTEKEPEIVFSDAKRINQHSTATWVIEDDVFKRVDSYTEDSDKISAYLNDLVASIPDEELELFFDVLEKTANQLGISNFYDFKEADAGLMTIAVDSLSMLTPEQKKRFMALARKVMADIAKGYVSDSATKAKRYVKEHIPFVKKSPEDKEKTES